MKKMIKVLLAGLSLISVNAFAVTIVDGGDGIVALDPQINGSLLVGGQYNATGGVNLADATSVSLATVFANGGTGDVDGTIDFNTPAGTGGSLSLSSFSPVTNFFSVGGWQLDLSTLTIVDQTAGLLNLSGLGVLSGNGYSATDVNWSFSSSSTTSYSMTVANVSAVPVPAAVWLFGSGLLGLVAVARRKD